MSNRDYPGMTDLGVRIARIEQTDDLLANYDRAWTLIRDSDQHAATAGTLVGRYYHESVADGRALYEICWIQGDKAYLRHLPVGDGYRGLTLEGLSDHYRDPLAADGILFAVKLAFVRENVRQRDALSALFTARECAG